VRELEDVTQTPWLTEYMGEIEDQTMGESLWSTRGVKTETTHKSARVLVGMIWCVVLFDEGAT
jgi:hypothetical protein